jgi:NADPH:quinone reductase
MRTAMRALRFQRHGKPREVLELVEVPTPAPGSGEVLVEVHATGLNPSDAKNIAGAFPQTTLPRIPGRDFAGRIVAGSAAWQGKDVFGTGAGLGYVHDGTHAEYVVVPEDALVLRPPSLTAPQAAVIGVPYITAAEGLMRAGIAAGDHVLVVGGTGAVGRAVAQVAKWSGAHVIATTLTANDVDDAARPSVDVWIDLSREDLTRAARAATDAGVDVAFNVVGGATFAKTLKALAIGGRMVCITAAKDPEVPLDLKYFYRNDLRLIGVDSLKLTNHAIVTLLRRLGHGFDRGALVVTEGSQMPLSAGIDAYADVDEGKVVKHVLLPRST